MTIRVRPASQAFDGSYVCQQIGSVMAKRALNMCGTAGLMGACTYRPAPPPSLASTVMGHPIATSVAGKGQIRLPD